jgi:hypothetical protein
MTLARVFDASKPFDPFNYGSDKVVPDRVAWTRIIPSCLGSWSF